MKGVAQMALISTDWKSRIWPNALLKALHTWLTKWTIWPHWQIEFWAFHRAFNSQRNAQYIWRRRRRPPLMKVPREYYWVGPFQTFYLYCKRKMTSFDRYPFDLFLQKYFVHLFIPTPASGALMGYKLPRPCHSSMTTQELHQGTLTVHMNRIDVQWSLHLQESNSALLCMPVGNISLATKPNIFWLK